MCMPVSGCVHAFVHVIERQLLGLGYQACTASALTHSANLLALQRQIINTVESEKDEKYISFLFRDHSNTEK